MILGCGWFYELRVLTEPTYDRNINCWVYDVKLQKAGFKLLGITIYTTKTIQ